MKNHFEVIIVGGGAMGSAAAFHLARRGVSVLCLDRHGFPNSESSHHGESRIIRMAYFEHPSYVPLLRRAYELWGELEKETGEELLLRTGIVYAGPPDSEVLEGSRRAANEHGIPLEKWSLSELKRRYPQFCVPQHYEVLWEPSGGILRPEACISAFARLAREAGADLQVERVQRVSSDGAISSSPREGEVDSCEPERAKKTEGVIREFAITPSASFLGTSPSRGEEFFMVTTDESAYSCTTLVLAAGAHIQEFLPDLPLTVTAQTAGWVEAQGYGVGEFPVFGIQNDAGTFHYGFPDLGTGVKVASHDRGDPDFRAVLPVIGLEGARTTKISECRYTNTPDGDFILDVHPDHPNVVIASCCSGHGFKFAPVIGEAIADLATKKETDLPIGFLSLARFGRA